MITFSLIYALALIFLSAFIPGAILSLGLMKKSDFTLLEKILAGFAFGWVLQGTLPFLEFVLLGVKFSYGLTLANTALLYIIAIGIFIWRKAQEEIPILEEFKISLQKDPFKYAIPTLLLLLFFVNFWVRIQTLTPIYQELDPYYYIYISQQIITQGFNPLNDQTAWYPEVQVSHRWAPINYYSLSAWYSLYTQGGEYNNYLLFLVGNIYPPLAAAFVAFFIYLGLRAWYAKEYALISSAVLSFIPIFLIKLMAGESEVQPYAFFSLATFICFLLWAQKKQDLRYMALAGVGYTMVSLGSSSEVVAAIIFIAFTAAQALTLFISKKDMEWFVKSNAVFIAIILLASIVKSAFLATLFLTYALAVTSVVIFSAILFLIQKSKIDREMQLYALGMLLFLSVLVFAFTPVGKIVKSIALLGLQVAEYTKPLDRTIAEQGTSGAVFEPQLGFLGKIFDHGIYIPIGYIFALPSMFANLTFELFSLLLNTIFGVNLTYIDKENSIMMAVLFFMLVASVYSLYRIFVKKEDTPAWLFITLVFPITLVGLIKAKYVIYMGFVLATALAFIFTELELLVIQLFNIAEEKKKEIFYALVAIGLVFVIMQFMDSTAPSLIKASFGTRFQDNPTALQQKFSDLCYQLRLKGVSEAQIENICAAGRDALAFANLSINNQYDRALCIYSLSNDPLTLLTSGRKSTEDLSGAAFRCQTISDYWIDSMEWIRYHTENNSRITSWWDYGHWENFFGQRNAVIRNEHASHDMIVEIAHDYISGTPEELKDDMIRYNSKYALFDAELLFSGSTFGGKYGALNYLACARNNQTNVSRSPGQSMCEANHLWTTIYIPKLPGPQDECAISFDRKGVIAYILKPVESDRGLSYELEPAFCAGQTTLADGRNISALYDIKQRSSDGTLKLHRAFMKYEYDNSNKFSIFTLLYNKEPVWMVNGTATSGWEDRTSKFYDSNLYNAFILEDLPGFQLVYKTPNGAVKIFKIKE